MAKGCRVVEVFTSRKRAFSYAAKFRRGINDIWRANKYPGKPKVRVVRTPLGTWRVMDCNQHPFFRRRKRPRG